MKTHSISTDNANIAHKVQLRREAVKDLDRIRVLDLFAGNNVLWSHFDCDKYYGVEIVKGKGKNLNANNVRIIASLDLSAFNVIDCDGYGVPIRQLEQIFKNPTLQSGTVIIYTAIGNAMSTLSKPIRDEFGLNDMYRECKVLFNKRFDSFFYAWLYNRGVRSVREYKEESQHFQKKYGYFVVAE